MSPIKIPYDVNNSDLLDNFLTAILPSAIDTLEEHTEARWGEMTPQHMIEHLRHAFRMSTDKFDVQCRMPKDKSIKLQAFLNTNRAMQKGITNPVTGDQLPELAFQNLQEAKRELKKEIQYFRSYYEEHPDATHIHPIFGKLGAEQWRRFHFKHCFHHLSQFDLITRE